MLSLILALLNLVYIGQLDHTRHVAFKRFESFEHVGTCHHARCLAPSQPHRFALAAIEKAGDAIKEIGQEFADAQKMPDLGSMDELTKDGAFYTVNNKNKLERDTTARNTPGESAAPGIPFGETGSKGSNKGSDSTKPTVAENVEKVIDNITSGSQ